MHNEKKLNIDLSAKNQTAVLYSKFKLSQVLAYLMWLPSIATIKPELLFIIRLSR